MMQLSTWKFQQIKLKKYRAKKSLEWLPIIKQISILSILKNNPKFLSQMKLKINVTRNILWGEKDHFAHDIESETVKKKFKSDTII